MFIDLTFETKHKSMNNEHPGNLLEKVCDECDRPILKTDSSHSRHI